MNAEQAQENSSTTPLTPRPRRGEWFYSRRPSVWGWILQTMGWAILVWLFVLSPYAWWWDMSLCVLGVAVLVLPWYVRRVWLRFLSVPLLLALSPFGFVFFLGLGSYFTGQGALMKTGLPTPMSYNVDPGTRLPQRSGGCVATTASDVGHMTHNACLRMMVALLGPMRGSYLGPYPDQPTTLAYLDQHAQDVDPNLLAEDRLLVADKEVRLRPGQGATLLRMCWPATEYGSDAWRRLDPYFSAAGKRPEDTPFDLRRAEGATPLRVALYQEQCVILEIVSKEAGPADASKSSLLFLFDRDTGDEFACYLEGAWLHYKTGEMYTFFLQQR